VFDVCEFQAMDCNHNLFYHNPDSTFDTDISEKKQISASAGIREYWVVNIKGGQLRVFRQPQGCDYLREEAYSQGAISPLALPGKHSSEHGSVGVRVVCRLAVMGDQIGDACRSIDSTRLERDRSEIYKIYVS
jgi:hypothetical protein